MEIRRRLAPAAIRRFVRSFSERRATLGETIVTAPLPARPDRFIELYFAERYTVSIDGAAPAAVPEMVVVGPQSYQSTRLFLSGEIHVFTIAFQPGGLHALLGLAMPHFVDQGVAAQDAIGPRAAGLRDALRLAPGFQARVAAAERWIADLMPDARAADPVDHAARLLERSGGRLRIGPLARHCDLSDRQFTRRFEAQTGLRPKMFARTVRFNAALAAKAARPERSWTGIVHDAGYADQSHFIRDCHALGGSAPADFFDEWVGGR